MRITLFGATGPTGKSLIKEALDRGLEVTVFARPSSSFSDPRVRLIQGELVDHDALREAIKGSVAVLSALGPSSVKHPKGQPITLATKAIISVMQQERIDRLIAISTGTATDPGDGFELKIRLPAFLIKLLIPGVYADIVGVAKVIRESGLNWTMVRIPILTDRPASRMLNVGLYGHTKHSFTIPRADVSIFMLDKLTGGDFVEMSPGISGIK